MNGSADKRSIDRLIDIMAELRSEKGCPWDREQTIDSIKANLVEECYETLDAIESGDPEKHREELGDLLLQVVFHSRIREEEGAFCFDDVADTICEKLVRRHPHVFGDESVADSDDVLRNWERIKREEKGTPKHSSTFKGLPRSMPALQKAAHVQSRAARLGFDWESIGPVLEKVEEELNEIRLALAGESRAAAVEEIGDLLFAVVNLSRFLDADPEDTLHRAIKKFIRRFRHIEDQVAGDGGNMNDCNLEELENYWRESKVDEKRMATANGDD